MVILHRTDILNKLLNDVAVFDFKLFRGTCSDFAVDIEEKELMDLFLIHGVLHQVVEAWAILDNFLKVLKVIFPFFLDEAHFDVQIPLHPLQRQNLIIAILKHPIFFQDAVDDPNRHKNLYHTKNARPIWAKHFDQPVMDGSDPIRDRDGLGLAKLCDVVVYLFLLCRNSHVI